MSTPKSSSSCASCCSVVLLAVVLRRSTPRVGADSDEELDSRSWLLGDPRPHKGNARGVHKDHMVTSALCTHTSMQYANTPHISLRVIDIYSLICTQTVPASRRDLHDERRTVFVGIYYKHVSIHGKHVCSYTCAPS